MTAGQHLRRTQVRKKVDMEGRKRKRSEGQPEEADDTKTKTRFAGKRVLVTGGANGIGRQIAEEFLREGSTVIIADIVQPAGVENTENRCCDFIRCDAAVPHEIEECCKKAGPIDILINKSVCSLRPHVTSTVLRTGTKPWLSV